MFSGRIPPCSQHKGARLDAAQFVHALRTQEPICHSLPHGQQVRAVLWRELHLLMPLQHIEPGRQGGHEVFGADPIGRMSHQEEHALDLRSIPWRSLVSRSRGDLLSMVEQPHARATVIARGFRERIQQQLFALRGCFAIRWSKLLEQGPPCVKAHGFFDVCLLGNQSIADPSGQHDTGLPLVAS